MSIRDKVADATTISALLTGAEQEALAVGDELPGVEHLVLAALGLPDGTAATAFGRLGVSPDAFRTAVAQVHAEALATVGVAAPDAGPSVRRVGPRSFRASATADETFRNATALKQDSGAGRLLGAHVVAAACEQERGTFPRALQALNVGRAELRAAAVTEARR
ncbi:Clp protease N-terminal domain-containing protein [Motilibacter aurantiacus]|uniref:Clp protease N-terminal domain-containing protein n=1 Tax=Motilibacter aurantiacus TaxID=2714955 RepID=UPI001407462E|nr:Clp protease N-terminal domain-containing protein [Motilibacter aurantiacus]NHC44510.1 Clp protease [Motilibacter aurantiacus]